MAILSESQHEFLKSQNIPLSKVMDATGLATWQWKAIMSDLDIWIAYGVSACRTAGHTLRTRAGHCIQCSPENLSYLKRHNQPGYIYIAQSIRGNLIKVGTSNDPKYRVTQLNCYVYGGRDDWVLQFKDESAMAGKAEAMAHHKLSQCAATGSYVKSGQKIECRELFLCTLDTAILAVKKALMECL